MKTIILYVNVVLIHFLFNPSDLTASSYLQDTVARQFTPS